MFYTIYMTKIPNQYAYYILIGNGVYEAVTTASTSLLLLLL